MNSLMSRKKKYRFQVDLQVEELQDVPFVCQELYVKVRLLAGGFINQSKSLMVKNQAVQWNETFKFCCKMTATASTGELDSAICRVSVRQEIRGGRSFQKLGYADVNLSQFAGSGGSQRYLLEAYDSKHRLHNSTLRVTVDMTLLSGDPCFKAQPFPRPIHPPNDRSATLEALDQVPPHTRTTSGSVGSITSLGYSSMDKKTKASEESDPQSIEPSHSRNSSNTSGSGYVSNASHSDNASHARSGSGGSAPYSEGGSLERSGRSKPSSSIHPSKVKDPRVASTREDPDDVINKLFIENLENMKPDDSAEISGLQLYILQDGTPSVGGPALQHMDELRPIIIPKR